jgi:hypothetical protein
LLNAGIFMKSQKIKLKKIDQWYALVDKKGQEISVRLNGDGTLDVACWQHGGIPIIIEPIGTVVRLRPVRQFSPPPAPPDGRGGL